MAMLSKGNRVLTAVMSTGHRSFIYGTQRSERIALREAEVVKESRFLGAEPRFLRLPFYDSNYEVSERDRETVLALLEELDPDWVFMPHAKDSHPAHVASRKIALSSLQRFLAGTRKIVEVWNYEGTWALFNRGNSIRSSPCRRRHSSASCRPSVRTRLRWRARPTTWPRNPSRVFVPPSFPSRSWRDSAPCPRVWTPGSSSLRGTPRAPSRMPSRPGPCR